MRTMRFVFWLAVPATILLGGLNAASAEVSEAAKQACTPDAMRLCSEFIPDPGRTGACMRRKYSQLSETCRAAFRGGRVAGRHGRHHGHVRHTHHYRHHH
jgi:hypothetical protein